MLRAALIAMTALWSTPLVAACGGESYLTQLPQTQQDEVAAAVAATPNANGLVWEMTRGNERITLVGTMHIYDPRLARIFDQTLPTLQTADLLLVEATDAEMTAMQEAFVADPSLYLITDGPTLPDLLAPDVWSKVQDAATARGIPSFMVAQFQPWYLALTLGIPACAMADVAAGKQGLDHMMSEAAAQAGVPVAPLEDWNTLIDVLTGGSQEEQIDMMKLGLIDAADQQALFVAMLDAYFDEQVAAVWEISIIAARELSHLTAAEAAEQMLETQETLLNTRNRNWIPVIETALETNDTLVVAVGAAHLPGEVGLISLLTDKGWTAERME
ncbi:MAG: TraB/GumN family protein [Pseudomonadota bacterium]